MSKIAQQGQTLIEVLIAFATLAVVITSATLTVISALNNAEFVKNQHLAIQYAQQGMEIVRSMRENNYNSFLTLSNPQNLPNPDRVIYYCMAAACTSLSPVGGDACGTTNTPCVDQNIGAFVRAIAIDKTTFNTCSAGASTQVTVSVSWTDGTCPRGEYCHTSSVVSCLAPINSVAIP
jgi:Tfp pilus assembly protein PilV